jgi:superoxide reductase
MGAFEQMYQTADWKNEKHVPVIEAPAEVEAGKDITISATVGKEIAHPNTTEHHIRWIQFYFKPEDDKFAHHLGSYEFTAHAESAAGPNEGPVVSHPAIISTVQLKKTGTLVALSYCNIHGLWRNETRIEVK